MARAALQWSLEDAGAAAGVSRRTILRFENDHRDIQPELVAAVRRAFEAAGVRFLDAGPDSGGVVPPPLRAASAKR
ncbi:MAG TPA: helix-turn-helix transcriptional regulator [Allosphingosinicella sp.]|nr:helix-turn-helix transcriptional regulator [Allosphingosinicella sp.]